MNEITVADLSALPAPTVIDVREPEEFVTGRVPGAVNIPLSTLGELGPDGLPDGPLYVICELGGRSAQATQYLEAQGREATNIAGGTSAWRNAGLPTEK